MYVSPQARGAVELSIDGRQGRTLLPGEGVRVGSAPLGWEVPCISRPARRKRASETGALASVSEDLVLQASLEGVGIVRVEEEAGGGWVEDLNDLLGFNKGFRGRFVDQEEE